MVPRFQIAWPTLPSTGQLCTLHVMLPGSCLRPRCRGKGSSIDESFDPWAALKEWLSSPVFYKWRGDWDSERWQEVVIAFIYHFPGTVHSLPLWIFSRIPRELSPFYLCIRNPLVCNSFTLFLMPFICWQCEVICTIEGLTTWLFRLSFHS